MVLENHKTKKRVFAAIAIVGLTGGVAAYYPVLLSPEVLKTSVADHSLRYDITRSPAFEIISQGLWHLAYLAVVTFPLIFSSQKSLFGFNAALVLSAAVSHLYFWYAFESVWCFFAAVLSLYLAFLFSKLSQLEFTAKAPIATAAALGE
jgi:hypothetical protein